MTKGLPGDQQVVLANGSTDRFEFGAEFASELRVLFIKTKEVHRPRKKASQETGVQLTTRTLPYAVP